jgi:hypothetical protein
LKRSGTGGHTRYGHFFPPGPQHYLFFKVQYLWPTDAYLYPQSCEIHRLGPNAIILID